MMNMAEVNQLIQQAYAMGQQSVLQNTGIDKNLDIVTLLLL